MGHINATKGDTISLAVYIRRTTPDPDNPAAAPTITPVNLGGSVSIWFTVKRDPADTDANALVQLGTPPTGLSGVEVTDAPGGKCRVVVPPAETTGLEAGMVSLYYDVQLKELDGTVTTVDAGRMALRDQVTITA